MERCCEGLAGVEGRPSSLTCGLSSERISAATVVGSASSCAGTGCAAPPVPTAPTRTSALGLGLEAVVLEVKGLRKGDPVVQLLAAEGEALRQAASLCPRPPFGRPAPDGHEDRRVNHEWHRVRSQPRSSPSANGTGFPNGDLAEEHACNREGGRADALRLLEPNFPLHSHLRRLQGSGQRYTFAAGRPFSNMSAAPP